MSTLETEPLPREGLVTKRISFAAKIEAETDVLCRFDDPYARYALSSLAEPGTTSAADFPVNPDELHVLLVPSGVASSMEDRSRSEQWFGLSGANGALGRIELVLRSDRILWRPGRAVIEGAPDRFAETLLAIAQFAFYEGELRKLEHETAADWDRVEADVPLTHGVTAQELTRWPAVNDMTEVITRRRIRFARLEPHLERSPSTLPGPAQRIFSELMTQAAVTDRLHALDDRLEVFEDLYELANDRLSEFTYFRTERRLEIWIIIILIAEIVVMLLELGIAYRGD